MTTGSAPAGPPGYLGLRDRFDDVLIGFLHSRRQEAEWADPRATLLVGEVLRLVEAGGRRIRPTFCYWGYRAAGAPDDDRIVTAASALELLHTFALIHDDLIDGARERRGVPSTQVRMQEEARARGLADPEGFGLSAAILAGDLAAVLADELLLQAGFQPMTLTRALARYNEMRVEMATGQILYLLGPAADEVEARRIASLKGGSYTVERPLLIGAALAGGTIQQQAILSRFGGPLGEAFQLLDDLMDDPARTPVSKETIQRLVEHAKKTLDPAVLGAEAVTALRALADFVSLP
ncbi:MAG: polyprenyl synthetase family protein [Actinobacteria bacterium]|nr:polyprenyl synthetase family protein [Actinomycetota bacterium]